jgi:hypothetical protein
MIPDPLVVLFGAAVIAFVAWLLLTRGDEGVLVDDDESPTLNTRGED